MKKKLRFRRFATAGSLLLLPMALLAQDSAQLKFPAGDLLKSAPDHTQWIVDYSYPSPASVTPPRPSPSDQYRTKSITTAKTGSVIHEETVNGAGQKIDLWFVGSTEYMHQSGIDVWQEAHPGPSNGLHYDGLPSNGFRGLGWVGASSYVGILEHGAHQYLVFTQSLSASDRKTVSVDQYQTWDSYALIDFTTRLPAEVKQLGAVLKYQFTDLPTEKQQLPPDLAQVLKRGQEIQAYINQQPPRPY
jgi:hypothetical protein